MKLFSLVDLRLRWNYTRAGIHNLVKQQNFPAPFTTVSNGKLKLFTEDAIQAYEQDKPWLFDEIQKQRRRNLYGQLQLAKHSEDPQAVLNKLFGEKARTWKSA